MANTWSRTTSLCVVLQAQAHTTYLSSTCIMYLMNNKWNKNCELYSVLKNVYVVFNMHVVGYAETKCRRQCCKQAAAQPKLSKVGRSSKLCLWPFINWNEISMYLPCTGLLTIYLKKKNNFFPSMLDICVSEGIQTSRTLNVEWFRVI